jgi:hypothetical protein
LDGPLLLLVFAISGLLLCPGILDDCWTVCSPKGLILIGGVGLLTLAPDKPIGLLLLLDDDPLLLVGDGPNALLLLDDPNGLMLLVGCGPYGLLVLVNGLFVLTDEIPFGFLSLVDIFSYGFLLLFTGVPALLLFDTIPTGILLFAADETPNRLLILADETPDWLLLLANETPDGLLLLLAATPIGLLLLADAPAPKSGLFGGSPNKLLPLVGNPFIVPPSGPKELLLLANAPPIVRLLLPLAVALFGIPLLFPLKLGRPLPAGVIGGLAAYKGLVSGSPPLA